MPLIRPGMRKPPPGFEAIQAKLEAFEEEMKLATQEESRGVVGQTTRPRRAAANSGASAGHKRSREPVDDESTPTVDNDQEAVRTNAENEPEVQSRNEASASSSAEAVSSQAPVPPLWRMAAINRARTRYVFSAYTKQHLISKEVYDYCVEAQLIDGGLARRWRLPGYERLCCTACGVPGAASLAANVTSKYALRDKQEHRLPSLSSLQKGGDNSTATCICRVPAAQRKNRHFMACAVCGCSGCGSADTQTDRTTSGKKEEVSSS